MPEPEQRPHPEAHWVDRLARSRVFADYQRAFTAATGLALALRAPNHFRAAMKGVPGENAFCALLSKQEPGCTYCLQMQAHLSRAASDAGGPASAHCFAGLTDSVVPVKLGERIVAYLQTGQVMLERPDRESFARASATLQQMGLASELSRLEDAYFGSTVLNETQYAAFLGLLQSFATHLSEVCNRLQLEGDEQMPPAIRRAIQYIETHHARTVRLEDVAKAANVSSFYFSRMFRDATGMTFAEHLARLRIERAKSKLPDPHQRISEIAYAVGFKSISQFNRSFSKYVGTSPSQWRKNCVA